MNYIKILYIRWFIDYLSSIGFNRPVCLLWIT